MLTAEYLPPYSLLVGQFLGAIRIFTAKESAQDDIFSMLEVESENTSAPVVINNVKVGVSDIPVSEINVRVNVSEPMFPVINNSKVYKVSVEKIVDAITRNPNNKLDIVITDSKFNVEYDNIQTFFPIESIRLSNTEEIQKEFENSAYTYLAKVYGVKMESNKAEIVALGKGKDAAATLVAQGDPAELQAAKVYLTELPGWMKSIVTYTVNTLDKTYDLAINVKNKITHTTQDVKQKISDTVQDIKQKVQPVEPETNVSAKTQQSPPTPKTPEESNVSSVKDKLSEVITTGKQKISEIKQAVVTFVDHYPLIATAIVVGVAAGALTLYLKRKSIMRFLKKESVNPNVHAALLDIADVLTVVDPDLSAEELYKQSKQILKQSGKKGIQNFNRLAAAKVAKENQQSGGGLIGLSIIAILLKIASFVYGAGFIIGLLGTLFLVIKGALGLGLNTDYLAVSAAATIEFGLLLGVTTVGYVMVRRYLDGKINRQINSEAQVKQQLVKANSKMFDLGYNVK